MYIFYNACYIFTVHCQLSIQLKKGSISFRSLVEVVAERESLIEALHRELEAMRAEVQHARSEATHNEDQLRLRINDLESTIAELVSAVAGTDFTLICVLTKL